MHIVDAHNIQTMFSEFVPGLYYSSTYYYNHITKKWTNGPNLIEGRKLNTAGFVIDHVTNQKHIVVLGDLLSLHNTVYSVEILFHGENEWSIGMPLF